MINDYHIYVVDTYFYFHYHYYYPPNLRNLLYYYCCTSWQYSRLSSWKIREASCLVSCPVGDPWLWDWRYLLGIFRLTDIWSVVVVVLCHMYYFYYYKIANLHHMKPIDTTSYPYYPCPYLSPHQPLYTPHDPVQPYLPHHHLASHTAADTYSLTYIHYLLAYYYYRIHEANYCHLDKLYPIPHRLYYYC